MYREPNDLHLILPPNGQRLMADKDLIEQVLINLIKNARENDATDIRISAGLSSGERPYIRTVSYTHLYTGRIPVHIGCPYA